MPTNLKVVITGLSQERQDKIKAKANVLAGEMIAYANGLAEARKAHHKTQEEIAQVLHIKQNAVAQLEKRSDLLLSTLRKYVAAMGGELDLVIRMGNGSALLLDSIGSLSKAAQFPPQPAPVPKGKVAGKAKPVRKLSKSTERVMAASKRKSTTRSKAAA